MSQGLLKQYFLNLDTDTTEQSTVKVLLPDTWLSSKLGYLESRLHLRQAQMEVKWVCCLIKQCQLGKSLPSLAWQGSFWDVTPPFLFLHEKQRPLETETFHFTPHKAHEEQTKGALVSQEKASLTGNYFSIPQKCWTTKHLLWIICSPCSTAGPVLTFG